MLNRVFVSVRGKIGKIFNSIWFINLLLLVYSYIECLVFGVYCKASRFDIGNLYFNFDC